MKIGITKIPSKEQSKNEAGVKFEYKIWFRTSDSKLHNVAATSKATIEQIIKVFGEAQAEASFEPTSNETTAEEFLERL